MPAVRRGRSTGDRVLRGHGGHAVVDGREICGQRIGQTPLGVTTRAARRGRLSPGTRGEVSPSGLLPPGKAWVLTDAPAHASSGHRWPRPSIASEARTRRRVKPDRYRSAAGDGGVGEMPASLATGYKLMRCARQSGRRLEAEAGVNTEAWIYVDGHQENSGRLPARAARLLTPRTPRMSGRKKKRARPAAKALC